MKPLSPKKEAFCREIALGLNPTEARRKVWKKSQCTAATHHSLAYRLMKDVQIQSRIKELTVPIVEKVRKTREELLDLFQGGAWFDPRKMFDTHGNPADIPALPDQEAFMLEGFEIVEEFSGKGADRVPVGYTRKFKLGDRHKYATSYGKMMGYIQDDPDPPDKGLKSLTLVFLNAAGNNVQVKLGNGHGNGHAADVLPAGVKFVR